MLWCSHGGERTVVHDDVCDAIYYIIRDARRAIVREKTGFLPSSIPGGRRGRGDLVISEPVCGHTLLDVIIADSTHVDIVVRTAIVPQHAALEAARQKERHYRAIARGHLDSYRHRDVRCVVVSNI